MTQTRTTGIQTTYDGTLFRSRLEARWAAFFRSVGWDYIYEPFDGNGYIPDFVLQGDRPVLVEVKPAVALDEYAAPVAKVTDGVKGIWHHDILIVGASPLPRLDSSFGRNYIGNAPFGWLGEHTTLDDGTEWSFGVGNWMLCLACRAYAFNHDEQSYAARPCSHYDGDHYVGPIGMRAIEQHWSHAGNDVRWRGAPA